MQLTVKQVVVTNQMTPYKMDRPDVKGLRKKKRINVKIQKLNH